MAPDDRRGSQRGLGRREPPLPVTAARGLSSKLNRDWVAQILEYSAGEQIAALLKSIRYRPPEAAQPASPGDMRIILEKKAAEYVKTPEGSRELKQLRAQALERETAHWLKSVEGLRRLEETKAALLANKVAAIPEVFERAYRAEIQRQVTRWVDSPRGQEAIEQAKKRILHSQISQTAVPKGPNWVDQALGNG